MRRGREADARAHLVETPREPGELLDGSLEAGVEVGIVGAALVEDEHRHRAERLAALALHPAAEGRAPHEVEVLGDLARLELAEPEDLVAAAAAREAGRGLARVGGGRRPPVRGAPG